jgi:hypothetical protein
MRKPVDQAVKKIIAGLFYPLEFAPTSLFSGPMLALAALLLLATGLLALPPLREVMRHALAVHCLDDQTREIGKQYSDFAQIMFQVLIAVAIGGLVVTRGIVAIVQAAVQRYQAVSQGRLKDIQRRMIVSMYRSYVYVKRISYGMTIFNFPFRLFRAVSVMNRALNRIFTRVPIFYAAMLSFRALGAFSEGFYGAIALLFLEGMILSKVAKSYFDYFPRLLKSWLVAEREMTVYQLGSTKT